MLFKGSWVAVLTYVLIGVQGRSLPRSRFRRDAETLPDPEYPPPMDYRFAYQVKHEPTTNFQNRVEVSEDGIVTGSFSHLAPDGVVRTTYFTDEGQGYKVILHEEPSEIVVIGSGLPGDPLLELSSQEQYDGYESVYAKLGKSVTQSQSSSSAFQSLGGFKLDFTSSSESSLSSSSIETGRSVVFSGSSQELDSSSESVRKYSSKHASSSSSSSKTSTSGSSILHLDESIFTSLGQEEIVSAIQQALAESKGDDTADSATTSISDSEVEEISVLEVASQQETEDEWAGETEAERVGISEDQRHGNQRTKDEWVGETESEREGSIDVDIHRQQQTEDDDVGETEDEDVGETEDEGVGEIEDERDDTLEIETHSKQKSLEQTGSISKVETAFGRLDTTRQKGSAISSTLTLESKVSSESEESSSEIQTGGGIPLIAIDQALFDSFSSPGSTFTQRDLVLAIQRATASALGHVQTEQANIVSSGGTEESIPKTQTKSESKTITKDQSKIIDETETLAVSSRGSVDAGGIAGGIPIIAIDQSLFDSLSQPQSAFKQQDLVRIIQQSYQVAIGASGVSQSSRTEGKSEDDEGTSQSSLVDDGGDDAADDVDGDDDDEDDDDDDGGDDYDDDVSDEVTDSGVSKSGIPIIAIDKQLFDSLSHPESTFTQQDLVLAIQQAAQSVLGQSQQQEVLSKVSAQSASSGTETSESVSVQDSGNEEIVDSSTDITDSSAGPVSLRGGIPVIAIDKAYFDSLSLPGSPFTQNDLVLAIQQATATATGQSTSSVVANEDDDIGDDSGGSGTSVESEADIVDDDIEDTKDDVDDDEDLDSVSSSESSDEISGLKGEIPIIAIDQALFDSLALPGSAYTQQDLLIAIQQATQAAIGQATLAGGSAFSQGETLARNKLQKTLIEKKVTIKSDDAAEVGEEEGLSNELASGESVGEIPVVVIDQTAFDALSLPGSSFTQQDLIKAIQQATEAAIGIQTQGAVQTGETTLTSGSLDREVGSDSQRQTEEDTNASISGSLDESISDVSGGEIPVIVIDQTLFDSLSQEDLLLAIQQATQQTLGQSVQAHGTSFGIEEAVTSESRSGKKSDVDTQDNSLLGSSQTGEGGIPFIAIDREIFGSKSISGKQQLIQAIQGATQIALGESSSSSSSGSSLSTSLGSSSSSDSSSASSSSSASGSILSTSSDSSSSQSIDLGRNLVSSSGASTRIEAASGSSDSSSSSAHLDVGSSISTSVDSTSSVTDLSSSISSDLSSSSVSDSDSSAVFIEVDKSQKSVTSGGEKSESVDIEEQEIPIIAIDQALFDSISRKEDLIAAIQQAAQTALQSEDQNAPTELLKETEAESQKLSEASTSFSNSDSSSGGEIPIIAVEQSLFNSLSSSGKDELIRNIQASQAALVDSTLDTDALSSKTEESSSSSSFDSSSTISTSSSGSSSGSGIPVIALDQSTFNSVSSSGGGEFILAIQEASQAALGKSLSADIADASGTQESSSSSSSDVSGSSLLTSSLTSSSSSGTSSSILSLSSSSSSGSSSSTSEDSSSGGSIPVIAIDQSLFDSLTASGKNAFILSVQKALQAAVGDSTFDLDSVNSGVKESSSSSSSASSSSSSSDSSSGSKLEGGIPVIAVDQSLLGSTADKELILAIQQASQAALGEPTLTDDGIRSETEKSSSSSITISSSASSGSSSSSGIPVIAVEQSLFDSASSTGGEELVLAIQQASQASLGKSLLTDSAVQSETGESSSQSASSGVSSSSLLTSSLSSITSNSGSGGTIPVIAIDQSLFDSLTASGQNEFILSIQQALQEALGVSALASDAAVSGTEETSSSSSSSSGSSISSSSSSSSSSLSASSTGSNSGSGIPVIAVDQSLLDSVSSSGGEAIVLAIQQASQAALGEQASAQDSLRSGTQESSSSSVSSSGSDSGSGIPVIAVEQSLLNSVSSSGGEEIVLAIQQASQAALGESTSADVTVLSENQESSGSSGSIPIDFSSLASSSGLSSGGGIPIFAIDQSLFNSLTSSGKDELLLAIQQASQAALEEIPLSSTSDKEEEEKSLSSHSSSSSTLSSFSSKTSSSDSSAGFGTPIIAIDQTLFDSISSSGGDELILAIQEATQAAVGDTTLTGAAEESISSSSSGKSISSSSSSSSSVSSNDISVIKDTQQQTEPSSTISTGGTASSASSVNTEGIPIIAIDQNQFNTGRNELILAIQDATQAILDESQLGSSVTSGSSTRHQIVFPNESQQGGGTGSEAGIPVIAVDQQLFDSLSSPNSNLTELDLLAAIKQAARTLQNGGEIVTEEVPSRLPSTNEIPIIAIEQTVFDALSSPGQNEIALAIQQAMNDAINPPSGSSASIPNVGEDGTFGLQVVHALESGPRIVRSFPRKSIRENQAHVKSFTNSAADFHSLHNKMVGPVLEVFQH